MSIWAEEDQRAADEQAGRDYQAMKDEEARAQEPPTPEETGDLPEPDLTPQEPMEAEASEFDAESPENAPEQPLAQLSFSVGGEKPTASTVRLVGGKIEAGGEYKKGQVVHLSIEAVVTEVAFVDLKDKETGQVVATERRHKLTSRAVEVL